MAMHLIPSYCFDDVLLRPKYSEVSSRCEINLETEIGSAHRSLKLKIPLISSPMDTVTDEKMAIKLSLTGGIGIIHRYMSIDQQVEQVANVKRYVNYIFRMPYNINSTATVYDARCMQELHNVKTLCVTEINPKNYQEVICVGILTERDLAGKEDGISIRAIMTPYDRMYKLFVDSAQIAELEQGPGNPIFTYIMKQARDMMNKYAVEKIPIFKVLNNCETQLLYGLVTSRSVQHYFDNQSMSCLDKSGRLCVGAAVGIRPGYLEHVAALVGASVDLVCVDVANGHNMHTIDAVCQIRRQFPDLIIMAGNICTLDGYKRLAAAGTDCIRIGIGNGSICTTRLETGNGFGQWSALKECADYIHSQAQDTVCTGIGSPAPNVNSTATGVTQSISGTNPNTQPKLICDGGTLGKTGNKVKALAIGACAIMMGRTLASCEESPGQIITRNGKRMKYFRGMASTMANLSKQETQQQKQESCSGPVKKKVKLETDFTAEGVDGVVDLKGSVTDVVKQIVGGLKSGLSYQGVYSIAELHNIYNTIEWALSTSIGQSETGIRVSTF
jgi:IMP dehydrogenase